MACLMALNRQTNAPIISASNPCPISPLQNLLQTSNLGCLGTLESTYASISSSYVPCSTNLRPLLRSRLVYCRSIKTMVFLIPMQCSVFLKIHVSLPTPSLNFGLFFDNGNGFALGHPNQTRTFAPGRFMNRDIELGVVSAFRVFD